MRNADDISNDVITLGMCFSMFVYICARFRFALIGGKSDSSVDREPQGNWRWNSNSRDVVASSPSISLLLVENVATPLMASTPGFEPGPWHYWEASVLTTAPPLLLIHLIVFLSLYFSVILRPWVLVRSWGVEPTTFRSAVKRSTDWECPASVKKS